MSETWKAPQSPLRTSDDQTGTITRFMEKYYLHFNAASVVDAARGYALHLTEGGKMMVTLAGAMSTAEMGKMLAEMIRQDKVHIISCTGANLEEDVSAEELVDLWVILKLQNLTKKKNY